MLRTVAYVPRQDGSSQLFTDAGKRQEKDAQILRIGDILSNSVLNPVEPSLSATLMKACRVEQSV